MEKAVYPYLGEARTAEDVEHARAALEKAYHEAGYQTASVQIPQQEVTGGLVRLQVVEGTVGRLRVHGSRYFDIERIKADAPSLVEGTTPDFNAVTADIMALNQHPDRRVTPALRAGVEPGTIDIDLNVEDTSPLHGNLELNNRHSANTTELRLNGSVSYANLWQREHTLGLSFQIAPERLDDAKVFSAYYLVPVPNSPVKLMVQGMKHDSDISTLGTFDVAGRGENLGIQAIVSLPGTTTWSHGLTGGIDYKHFDELLTLGGTTDGTQTPITYYPCRSRIPARTSEKRASRSSTPGSISTSAAWAVTRKNLPTNATEPTAAIFIFGATSPARRPCPTTGSSSANSRASFPPAR